MTKQFLDKLGAEDKPPYSNRELESFIGQFWVATQSVMPKYRIDNGWRHQFRVTWEERDRIRLVYTIMPPRGMLDEQMLSFMQEVDPRHEQYMDRVLEQVFFSMLYFRVGESYKDYVSPLYRLYSDAMLLPRYMIYTDKPYVLSFLKHVDNETWLCEKHIGSREVYGTQVGQGYGPTPTAAAAKLIGDEVGDIDKVVLDLYNSFHPMIRERDGWDEQIVIEFCRERDRYSDRFVWCVATYNDKHGQHYELLEERDYRLDAAIEKALQARYMVTDQIQKYLAQREQGVALWSSRLSNETENTS